PAPVAEGAAGRPARAADPAHGAGPSAAGESADGEGAAAQTARPVQPGAAAAGGGGGAAGRGRVDRGEIGAARAGPAAQPRDRPGDRRRGAAPPEGGVGAG